MYSKCVDVYYDGVTFSVWVSCTPDTTKDVLEERAIKIIESAFAQYGITICK
jgi:hypothetical protein